MEILKAVSQAIKRGEVEPMITERELRDKNINPKKLKDLLRLSNLLSTNKLIDK